MNTITQNRQSVESYAHKAAKATIVGWLRDAAAAEKNDRWIEPLEGISWRVNRGAPHYGVWEEYPITQSGEEVGGVWDESQLLRGLSPNIPTYQDMVVMGRPPKIILDVAVQHKGCIIYGFEIVHKNDLTDNKRDFLQWLADVHDLRTYSIDAGWILSQVSPPKRLVIREAFTPAYLVRA